VKRGLIKNCAKLSKTLEEQCQGEEEKEEENAKEKDEET
jgi:hypothetical protein